MFNPAHSQAIFQGGNYTLVNNIQNNHQHQTPWDRLQSSAAPSAFHNSGDDFDAPKCHPNTRVAVLSELRDFSLRRGSTGSAKILWLNGAAGAGKSAIARSLCEECATSHSLLASFFFNRSDPSRNNHKAFVATITYQLFRYLPAHNQSLILAVIECDPLIFTRSIDAQFQALIVRPLQDLFESGQFETIGRLLIVIDGLDECSPTAAQLDILRAMQRMSNQPSCPFLFIIASRPEHDLQTFFRSPAMVPLLRRLELDDSYLPNADIERFLVNKLRETRGSHPLKNSIPRGWPPSRSIRALVHKASGQFIFANIVVNYVTSTRHRPDKRLDYIINLCPPKGDLPFAELDALYLHILSHAEGDIHLALRVIAASELSKRRLDFGDIADIWKFDFNDALLAFSDLRSVLRLRTGVDQHQPEIFHKSFTDFLFDSTRSGNYFINPAKLTSELVEACIRYISVKGNAATCNQIIEILNADNTDFVANIAFFREALESFSLTTYFHLNYNPLDNYGAPQLFYFRFIESFGSQLLNQLSALIDSDDAYLFDHCVNQVHDVYERHLAGSPAQYLGWRATGHYGSLFTTTLRIVSTDRGSQLIPQDILESPAIKLLARADPKRIPLPYQDEFARAACSIGNLLSIAALRCLKFLQRNIDRTSVNSTLIYLDWALPFAAPSSQLNAACEPAAPFAYVAMPDIQAEPKVEARVTAEMERYRERYAQYLLHQGIPIV